MRERDGINVQFLLVNCQWESMPLSVAWVRSPSLDLGSVETGRHFLWLAKHMPGWWFGTWLLWLAIYNIGNVIIPTDELIFLKGVGQPPTSHMFMGRTWSPAPKSWAPRSWPDKTVATGLPGYIGLPGYPALCQLSQFNLNWQLTTGWWFQSFFIFHFIYGMSSFPLAHWLSYFSRWLKPPTRTWFIGRVEAGNFFPNVSSSFSQSAR